MKDTGKRFLPAQDAFQKKRGTASGICIPAQAVTMRFGDNVVVLIASSEETLREAWSRIVDIEMDARGAQDIVIFAARDTKFSEPSHDPAPHPLRKD